MNLCRVLGFFLFLGAWTLAGEPAESLAVAVDVSHTYILESTTEKREFVSWPPPFYKWVTGSEFKTHRESCVGTAWATETGGKRVLVTAAHVLAINQDQPVWKNDRTSAIVRRSTSVAFGRLGSRANKIGLITSATGQIADIAIVVPDTDIVFQGLQIFAIANRIPALQEMVSVIGFPAATTFPKVIKTEVVEISRTGGFFVINERLAPGYSGGVVLDEKGRALGVVTGRDANQTTVLAISTAQIMRSELSDAGPHLEKNFPRRPKLSSSR